MSAADVLGFPRLSWQLPRHGSCGRATLSLKALASGHSVGTQGTLFLCSLFLYLPWFLSFFLQQEIKGNVTNTLCTVCSSDCQPRGSASPLLAHLCAFLPCWQAPPWGAVSTHLGPGQVRLHSHVMVPARGVAAHGGDALKGPKARDRGKARAGGGSHGQGQALRDAGWWGRCFPHESSFVP